MKKTFVVDTNVLLQSPSAIYSFGDNVVVLPDVVLEELDKFKKEKGELGANARECARVLERLRQTNGNGNLLDGLRLDGGGLLRVEVGHSDVSFPKGWSDDKKDNKILKTCLYLKDNGDSVYLVTKDIFLRIKAEIIGVVAQDFFAEMSPDVDEQYKGRRDVYADEVNIDKFFKYKKLRSDEVFEFIGDDYSNKKMVELVENEFLIIHSIEKSNKTALAKFDGKDIVSLEYQEARPFGVRPRNAGQTFMQEALMVDANKAPLVIIKGPAGTAKTFYSLAVGLQKVLVEQSGFYRKILVCRPTVKMDEDIGFLPGSEGQKIAPFLRPVVDNLEILIDNNEEERYKSEVLLKDKVDELFDRKIITAEAIAFIRGRSITKHWVIIDEAQNLTPKQVKGIITRAGKDTKIVLVGDPEQIDQAFLDRRTNGLCYASEKMKGSSLCYQVTLTDLECERSPLAHEGSVRM